MLTFVKIFHKMYLSHKIENDVEYVNNEFLSPQPYVTRTVIDKYISLKTTSYSDLACIACMHYKYDAMGGRNKDLKMMEQNKCEKMMAKYSEFNIKEFISQCSYQIPYDSKKLLCRIDIYYKCLYKLIPILIDMAGVGMVRKYRNDQDCDNTVGNIKLYP
jgi:hypothetical protein